MKNYNNIPQELRKLKQWVGYTSDKLPKNCKTGGNAMSNNPETWSSYDDALAGMQKYGFEGIGFMFGSGYFGVDLDHCLDNTDFVDEFVETLQTYNEISKSGNGLHLICKGSLPEGNRRRGGVEMYSGGRYFALTGNIYNDKYTQIVECTETIKPLHAKYLADLTPKVAPKQFEIVDLADEEIINKARNCKTGSIFQLLYSGNWEGLHDSQSDADYSLCKMLAFWTQCNKSQMDRIFRSSGLMRDKWDSKRGSTTYGNITLDKAVANCGEVYQPSVEVKDTDIALKVFGRVEQQVITPKKQYDMTDTGNAERLKDKFKGNIKYSYINKCWYYWSGKVWNVDQTGEIKKLTDTIVEDLKREGFDEEDADAQKQMLQFANKSGNSKSKENMIKELQHLQGIPVLPDELDGYRDFLNVQNGIINLRNGELIAHDPNFLQSKISFAEYDNTGTKQPERWLQFLNDVCNGNKELIKYLQKCVGYSLTGSTKEQCLFFLYGMGNNGKSTFLEIVSDLLGTYASNTQPETIMLGNKGSGANSDIARLKSSRFITCEEATEGVRLNEGLIKQLTGGSKITARFLYGSEFEYTPEFKIWIATNHKPVIRGNDLGIWRRIRLIPFEYTVPKEKVDKTLRYKLREELPQIMKWAVDGCLLWQKEGIDTPAIVSDATKEYQSEMDLLQAFIDECITIDYSSKETVGATQLYQLYCAWCKERNEYTYSNRKFGLEITKKLPDKKRTGNGYEYLYIKVNNNLRNYSVGDFK